MSRLCGASFGVISLMPFEAQSREAITLIIITGYELRPKFEAVLARNFHYKAFVTDSTTN